MQSRGGEMKYLLLIVNILIWPSVSVADACSHLPGYNKYGTSCFKLYTTIKNWTDAEASCVADGGHLASIHSSDEQAFVTNLVAHSTQIWIGIKGVPPNMAWSDNTDVNYDAWNTGNPSGIGEKCGRMESVDSFLWITRSCTRRHNYLCRADEASHQTQAYFMLTPQGVPVAAGAVPSSTHTVVSVIDCARRCQQDVQCVHFIMSEAGGKYLCETYTTLMRPPTPTPPSNNYQKIV